jgi:hypothetical protein
MRQSIINKMPIRHENKSFVVVDKNMLQCHF